MVKKIQLLGLSTDGVCVIFDILRDNQLAEHIDIFLNIEVKEKPKMAVMEFPYTIYGVGKSPDPTIPVVFGTSGPKNKYKISKYFIENCNIKKSLFTNIIHKSAYVARSSSIAMGGFLEQKVVISSQTTIGFGVTIKRGALVGHHCSIKDFVDINPGVTISGNVTIGKGVILGSGVTILDGISIGDNTFIGAGSVVTKNIPSGVIAYGNPCRIVRHNKKWKI